MIAMPIVSAPPQSVVAARAAVATFPNITIRTPDGDFPLAVVMVAIGGAETGGTWSATSQGDYGLGSPSCHGYTSFGVWQVHLPAWADVIARVSGVPATNPCGQAQWLYDVGNCAQMANIILTSNPVPHLVNWTTWQNGAYRNYLSVAQAAVSAVQPAAPVSNPTYSGGRTLSGVLIIAAIAGVTQGYGTYLSYEELKKQSK